MQQAVAVGKKSGWVQDSDSVDFPSCLKYSDTAVVIVA